MKNGSLFFCGLSALVLFVMVPVHGGGKPESPAGQAAVQVGGAVTYPLVKEGTATLKFWFPLNASVQSILQTYNDTDWYKEILKKTGVSVEFINPPASQTTETFNLLMVSGDLPDMIGKAGTYQGGAERGVQDGLFTDLTPLVEANMPDYAKTITLDSMLNKKVRNEDGTISAIYRIQIGDAPPPGQLLIRKDVLAAAGETKPPLTLADYERLLPKLKALGMIPYQLSHPAEGIDWYTLGIYGLKQDFLNHGGKVFWGPAHQDYKKYLALMNDWYGKGYIPKDFMTIGSETQKLFVNKELGIGHLMSGVLYNLGLKQKFEIIPLQHPRLSADQKLHWEQRWQDTINDNPTAVSAKSRNKELALRWLNYGFTPEGSQLYTWGIEGLSYTMVNGALVYTEAMLRNSKYSTEELSYMWKMRDMVSYNPGDAKSHANLLADPGALAARMRWSDDPGLDSEYTLPAFKLTDKENTRRSKIMTDVRTYSQEMTVKFIVGAEPLENFNKYIETMEKFGIREAEEITQTAYDRTWGKK
ncbi:MAG: extracellular solute-binding protein [Treponema sp.]|jgi:putative aldouronate transport system substrate-binding protein|nr:extracellular solute-binding protein [Treponema sp.]